MASPRRNAITPTDARLVLGVALVSGVAAVFSGCRPTGNEPVDFVLCAATAVLVTWLGASTPWWGLIAASGAAGIVAAAGGSTLLMGAAWIALGVAVWIGSVGANLPWLRAAIAGVAVQVAFRFDWNPFFLASAAAAAVVIGVIAVAGVRRRSRHVRRRILWSGVGLGVAVVLALAGLGVGAVQARPDASRGYGGMLDGLEFVQNGDTARGAGILREASADLANARDALGAPWVQPARLVPGAAQNRDTTYEVLGRASDAALATADTLDEVDIDQLTVVNGAVDLSAFDRLQAPLASLEATVTDLAAALDDARTDWLVDPLRGRFENAESRVEQVRRQAVGTSLFARLGPDLLGDSGARRYLVAFVNNAEARSTGGLMGNWSELTIDRGRITRSASGRTAELQRGIVDQSPVELDMPPWFFSRYGQWALGGVGNEVGENAWVTATLSPDMPTVGAVYAQLYLAATGRSVDGVIVIDPAALAAMLDITGPIDLPDFDVTLTSENAEQFLVVDQYQFVENEREDLLESVSATAVERILGTTLPPPHELGRALGPPALEGHLSGYLVREDEQELLEIVGMDGALPEPFVDTASDILAVTTNNSSGNKIDSFLERSIEYRADFDPGSGHVDATLRIELSNDAPTTGYPDYVIGNIVDAPIGTNKTLLEVLTPLAVDQMLVDGTPDGFFGSVEGVPPNALNAGMVSVVVPPGGTAIVEVTLSGELTPGGYELLYRPQALPRADALTVDVRTTDGRQLVRHEGSLLRRSVLDVDGARPWR